jgi:Cu2+-exporting ATPase
MVTPDVVIIILEFWWGLAALVTIMLLGHWQEMKATGPGQLVLVRAGGRVPADGTIEAGEAEIDEAMITGESRPVAKTVGDSVVAGTIATDSSIRIRVTAVGDDTALAGIQRLVAEAQQSNSRAQVLADRFAGWLFYVATGSAIITFVAWTFAGNSKQAVTSTVTVLVVACPHALGLAIPLVISLSTAVAARNGILVKDRLALERMRNVTAILFDKTGTWTEGHHVVTGVVGSAITSGEVLRLAGGVERDSEHPLARAIVSAAREQGELAPATEFRSITGRGVEANIADTRYAVGGPVLLRERGLTVPEVIGSQIDTWTARGAAVLHLIRDDAAIGAIALEDEIRPETRQAVADLHSIGVERVVMITGDSGNWGVRADDIRFGLRRHRKQCRHRRVR